MDTVGRGNDNWSIHKPSDKFYFCILLNSKKLFIERTNIGWLLFAFYAWSSNRGTVPHLYKVNKVCRQ